MRLKAVFMKAHRWLGLLAATLWILQAATGIICVFHWELDDFTLKATTQALDLNAIQKRVSALAPKRSGRVVTQIWTSAGLPGRWDVSISGTPSQVVRIDNGGRVLRVRHEGERIGEGGLLDSIDMIHQTLLAGDVGSWVIGVSGLLLVSNILMGLAIGWPRRGQWRRTVALPRRGPLRARLSGWHRSLGLLVAVPALVLVATGVERVFSDRFEELVGAATATAPIAPPNGVMVGFASVVAVALERHPDAKLSAVIFPTKDDATWTIRLLEPGELRRAYGKSAVFIDGRDGHVVADYEAARASVASRVADAIFPIHTGEALGFGGRIAVAALGTWLIAMTVIGLQLWWRRRQTRKD